MSAIHHTTMKNSKPYDAEVEYLESTGWEYIDTGVSVDDPKRIKILKDEEGEQPIGFVHNFNANGAWLGDWPGGGQTEVFYRGFNGVYRLPYTQGRISRLYDGSSGYYENDKLLKSFTAAIVNGDISKKTWLVGAYFDFNINDVGMGNNVAGKIFNIKVWVDNILVRDLAPVRKDSEGCFYDRVSKMLFHNQGEGAYILGDKL